MAAGGDRAAPSAARAGRGEDGTSLVELVLALAVVASTMAVVAPATAASVDASHGRHAAVFLATRFRAAHQHAIFASHATAIVFDQFAGRWTLRVCEDENGNGVRRSEITAGRDACTDGPYDVAAMFPGVAVGVDPSLPGPDGEPGSPDAVRFGRSNLASFSPAGSGTAGTIFLRSAAGRQYAVRVSNVTGRTRVLRYDTGVHKWIAE
jgi:hypothetical protein